MNNAGGQLLLAINQGNFKLMKVYHFVSSTLRDGRSENVNREITCAIASGCGCGVCGDTQMKRRDYEKELRAAMAIVLAAAILALCALATYLAIAGLPDSM
jgi:hypothetical protein